MSSEDQLVDEQDSDRIVLSDPDDYAKTAKIRRLTSLKSKVQAWDKPGMTEIERYYHRIRNYGSELLPVIQEALEHGTIHKEDLRYEADSDGLGYTFDVLKFLQTGECHYVSIRDSTERFSKAFLKPTSRIKIRDGKYGNTVLRDDEPFNAKLHRDTLDRHFSKLIEVESKLGLGFSFETKKSPAKL